MDLTRIDTIVQFTRGTTSLWNNAALPVPNGAIVIDTTNKIVKEGDGVTLFENLPVCLDYNFQGSTSGAIVPEGDNVGKIAIADDSSYSPSGITLESILQNIITLNTKSASQQDDINTITLDKVVAEVSEGVVDGTIVICQNGEYVPGNKTLIQLIADIAASIGSSYNKIHLTDFEWYTDSGLTNRILSSNELDENNTYWCKITGFHDNAELKNVDFGLATTNPNVTITNSAKEITSALIAVVYGGTGDDVLGEPSIDSQDNIICVGYTSSEGSGSNDALIVKFDSSLNIVARKRYGGTGSERFQSVTIDSNDNIICCGHTTSEGLGGTTYGDTLIIKFDSSLNILARKRYGGTADDIFTRVTTDLSDNIICCGYTSSEGLGGAEALIVKFDPLLNIVARKRYGGTNQDNFYGINVDHSNNIICVGNTLSEGLGGSPFGDALVVKFDSSLNIVARKRYGGTGADIFTGVTTDSQNNIICGGRTMSEGTATEALVVKFDSSLNIVARKRYGGAAEDLFYSVTVDSGDNIICCGYTASEGLGSNDAFVVKFDSSLNIITRKRYGGTGAEVFWGVTIDSLDNIICTGSTTSEGLGIGEALVVKFPKNMLFETVVGSVLTGLTLADSTLTLADSALTLADSALTLADSALTLANSALTLAASTLTLEKDILVAARYTNPTELISIVYTSTDSDKFTANTIDTLGNIICVGSSVIGGTEKALIVKFNYSFTAIARKVFDGNFAQGFNSVVTDSSNNIICVGRYSTSSGGANEAFLVKFSSDLTSVIIQKTYGATGDDVFNDITIDPSGNFIVVGYTSSEGTGLKDGLVVKFSSTFTITYRKRYGGTGNDIFNSVTSDANGNSIIVGSTSSEGANTSGLILKLDANLNIVLRKYYNSTLGTTTEFYSTVVTAANVIYCAGRIITATGNKGLIIKFDSNLNTTGNKVYGNSVGSTEFTGVKLDSTGNVFVVGKTNAEGAGNYDALILGFDSTLSIIGRKTYGTIGEDADIDCVIDSNDNIIITGYGYIGSSTDAIVTKIPNNLPEGLYTNKILTDLILSDSRLTLSQDAGTLSNSTTAMADSGLIFSNGSMSISDANGAVVKDITIMDAIINVFKVQVGNVVAAEQYVDVTFNVTANDGVETANKNIAVQVNPSKILELAYGGTDHDVFQAVAIDSNDNIICCGYTYSEGLGSVTYTNALVVKFDSSLNILARKIYSGSTSEYFYSISTDSNDNIICVGRTSSEGTGGYDFLIIKFDSSLNILVRKIYGSANEDDFYGIAIDSSDNIICVGYTANSGNGEAQIVKFDNDLNILYSKSYGNAGGVTDTFQGVVVDSNDNIICCGYTASEGTGSTTYHNALVVKFDTSLNIIARKIYGGALDDQFWGVTVDSLDNIICVGYTKSEGAGDMDALVIKYDKNLSIVSKRVYGGTLADRFYSVTTDSNDNVICAGQTYSEGVTGDCLVIKFTNDLSIISRKRIGGTSNDAFNGVTVDSLDNIICAGYTLSKSGVKNDAFVIKFPKDIPSGTIIGTVLTNLTLADSALTLADSNLTSANSALTLANNTLTLKYSALTLTNSTLAFEKDTISV